MSSPTYYPPAAQPYLPPAPPPAPRRAPFGTIVLLATTCVGLMAGIFWGFALSVMPGLARTDDATFVHSMQQMNAAIENLPFGLVFVGGLVFPAVAVVSELRARRRSGAILSALALLLYVVTLAITAGINIPLNNALAAAGTSHHAIAAARQGFEGTWVAAHAVRTLTCTLSMLCLILVALGVGRSRAGRS